MEKKKYVFENTIKDYNKTMDEYLDWHAKKTERKNPERLVSYSMLSESELTRIYGACTWCKSMQDQCVWIYEAFNSVHSRPVCLKCGMKNLSNKDISAESNDESKINSYVCKPKTVSESNCSLCKKYKCKFTIIRS